MEEREINLINLLYEFKRKLAIILVAGLVVGVAFAGYTFFQEKGSMSGLSYGSVCGIRVDYIIDQQGEYQVVSSEKNKGVILSDAVLETVAKKIGLEVAPTEMRKMIYVNGSTDGNMMKVYVVTSDQEQAYKICEVLGACATEALNGGNIKAELVQAADKMGAVSVAEVEDSSKLDGVRYTVKQTAASSLGAKGIAKKGIIGFIIGAVLAYVCVCVIYIIRGKVVYANEIDDAGIELLGILFKDEKKNDYSLKMAASNVLIKNANVKTATLLRCGSELELNAIKKAWDEVGISVVEGGDILVNPLAKLDSRKADTTVIIVKSNTIKVEDLYKLAKQIEDGATGVSGAIFVE